MLVKVKGLVMRSELSGERDRLYRVLTANGKLYVMAKGAVGSDGKPKICLLPMLYAELVLYKKGDRYWLREYEVLEDFRKLYRELDRLALGQYIMSLADTVSVVDQERSELLSLSLNALYLLAETERPCVHIKAVTELRVALDEGYSPELEHCVRCGKTPATGDATLDVMAGGIVCGDCLYGGPRPAVPPDADEIREASVLSARGDSVLAALRYVFAAPPKKAFSFALPDAEAEELGKVAELYLLSHIGENFPELKIYKDTIKKS
jgi:DNA repair protein RecO